jgi:hypothetical protein
VFDFSIDIHNIVNSENLRFACRFRFNFCMLCQFNPWNVNNNLFEYVGDLKKGSQRTTDLVESKTLKNCEINQEVCKFVWIRNKEMFEEAIFLNHILVVVLQSKVQLDQTSLWFRPHIWEKEKKLTFSFAEKYEIDMFEWWTRTYLIRPFIVIVHKVFVLFPVSKRTFTVFTATALQCSIVT